ncbi:MAG: ABC transporter ATP-binding protein [Hyphomicrobiales bacterium]|nr:ABC transporter ATP-binding protein [Hyphomicrobiales bacterium]
MNEVILRVRDLVKHFDGVTATDSLSLEVLKGEVHAIIGPNGAGKTTLINQLSGVFLPDSGTIKFKDADITALPGFKRVHLGLARSFQITSIFKNFTVRENVALAIQSHAGHSFKFWRPARNDSQLTEPAQALLERIELGDRGDVLAGNLAHGEQRQLEIAMALAGDPEVILLDEPMAGMGGEDSDRMVQFLSSFKGRHTLLLIEHDMDAVFALADRITVLVYGRVIATGTPAEIRSNEEVRQAYLGEDEAA